MTHRACIPAAKRPRIRTLLGGGRFQRDLLDAVIAKLDNAEFIDAEHLAVTLTDEEREAAAFQLAGQGAIDGKLCLYFSEAEPHDADIPRWSRL